MYSYLHVNDTAYIIILSV